MTPLIASSPPRLLRTRKRPVKLMIANNKGGEGKSFFVVNLADALARAGLRVLVGDMDPQGNATRRLGIDWDPENPFVGMPEVIAANQKGAGESAVYSCGWTVSDDDESPSATAELIDVIPSRFDLINRETETGLPGATLRLRKALSGDWIEEYDVVLIDSQPDLGHLVQMGLAAADYVIVVTSATKDGVTGAFAIDDFIARHGEDLNENLRVGGVVVNAWSDTVNNRFFLDNWLRPRFEDTLWDLKEFWNAKRAARPAPTSGRRPKEYVGVPAWNRFKEADDAGVSLTRWSDAKSRETVEVFDELAKLTIDNFLKVGEPA